MAYANSPLEQLHKIRAMQVEQRRMLARDFDEEKDTDAHLDKFARVQAIIQSIDQAILDEAIVQAACSDYRETDKMTAAVKQAFGP